LRNFSGYSVGKWSDTDNDGTYDTLEVETRYMQGPRLFDSTGIPLHKDNQTVVKEKLYLDKADRNILRNEITTIRQRLDETLDGEPFLPPVLSTIRSTKNITARRTIAGSRLATSFIFSMARVTSCRFRRISRRRIRSIFRNISSSRRINTLMQGFDRRGQQASPSTVGS